MKKSKLLIPFAALAGTAAIAVPMMSMTSCAQGEKEVTDKMKFKSEVHVVKEQNVGLGSYELDFTCDDDITAAQAKDIKIEIICRSTSSPITILRCITSFEVKGQEIHDFKATVYFSVDPAEITKDGVKMVYDIKIHNGSWYQMLTDHSLTVKLPE